MDRADLEKHTNHKMKCKSCGETYSYFDVVAYMDSCELPGNLIWINGCKKCGGMDYEEIS